MGATVTAYWEGITDEDVDSQPGFSNDDNAWASFIAERENEESVQAAFRRLNAGPLLTYTTNGVDDDYVDWYAPWRIANACTSLADAVRAEQADTSIILEVYARNANGADPIKDEFIRDLDDIAAIAKWAEARGIERMTLAVNW